MNWLVAGKFEILRKLGSGTYGEIYLGHDIESNQEVALKFERAPSSHPQLRQESQAYTHLAGGLGIPAVIWIGFERSYTILVIEILGHSLEDQINLCRRPFSTKTVLMVVDQSLRRIEFIHRKGLLHRDIKPSNILLGLAGKESILYFIDFGLSIFYCDRETGKHIPQTYHRDLIGTPRFASLNVMRGLQASRRDDLISLGYVWVYLFKGALPWQNLELDAKDARSSAICKVKEATSVEQLCAGMPDSFVRYFQIIGNLGFDDEPPYSELRALFCETFVKMQLIYDSRWDWLQPVAEQPGIRRRFSLAPSVVNRLPNERSHSRPALLRSDVDPKGQKKEGFGILDVPKLPQRVVRLSLDEANPGTKAAGVICVPELKRSGSRRITGRRQSLGILTIKKLNDD